MENVFVVTVEGGCVTGVHGPVGSRCVLIDFDCEGADAGTTYIGKDECFVTEQPVDPIDKVDNDVYGAVRGELLRGDCYD